MINWERIAELQAEVGEDDFAEVLEVFFEEVEETMSTLNPEAPEELAGSLHFLKGAALNIGMEALSDQCRDAETVLKSSEQHKINIDALRQTLDQSQAELREILG